MELMTTATSHPALSLQQLAELERKATHFETLAKSALPPHLPTSSDLEALDAARADFKATAHPQTVLALLSIAREHLRLVSALEFLTHPKTNETDVCVNAWPGSGPDVGYYELQVGYVDAATTARGATAAEAYVALAKKRGWTPESEAE